MSSLLGTDLSEVPEDTLRTRLALLQPKIEAEEASWQEAWAIRMELTVLRGLK